MAGYNRTRFVEELLERTHLDPPSFTVHLHPEHWVLNNGSKFLYHNQTASLLDDIRAHRIPVDFLDLFDAARVPFYEGCLIVELLDYRPRGGQESIPDRPEKTRVVLHPNSETMWADICNLNARYGYKWTDKDALEVESKLLLATGPKLCLDPDPHLTRIANHVIRVSTPTVPLSLKRKPPTQEPEENDAEKAKRLKLMSFMNPRSTRATPSYRLLDAISAARQNQGNPLPASTAPPVRPISTQPQPQAQMNQQASLPPQPIITSAPPTQPQQPPLAQAAPAPVLTAQQPPPPQPQLYSIAPSQTPTPAPSSHTHSPPNSDSLTPAKKKEQSTPQVQFSNPAFIRAANSQTPVPAQPPQAQQTQAQAQQQAAHNLQFINSHPPGVQQPQGPSQPATVYPNVHAAARAATPAQIQQQATAAAQQLKIQQLKQMQAQALQSQQMAGQGQQGQGAQAQAQQLLQQQQQQQQQSHYRQSPKPPNPQIAAAAVQHVHQQIQQQQAQQAQQQGQQQQPQQQAGQVPFQPPLPTQQFLQQPPAARNAAAAAVLQGKMPNGTMNLNPAQARIYQAALLQQQQRLTAMQLAQPMGGRATPQMPGQQQGSPSPVRGSPVVNAATLAAARRSSPMPGQQGGQGATFMQYNPGSSHMRPPTAAGMAGSPRIQAAPSPASSAGAVEGGGVQQQGIQQQAQQQLPAQTQHSVQSIQTMAAAAVANVPLAQREQAYQSYMYQVQIAMAARANQQQAGPYWQSMLARGMPGQAMNPAAVAAAQAQAAAAGQQTVSGKMPR